ncbi:MAG TPA: CAP domain-containing protein [Gaiellaceae bacterium]|nr:CAP domain-containing protein [Gaiellaceae bacterium]
MRAIAPIVAGFALLGVAPGIAAGPANVAHADELEAAVLEELNLVRLEHGLRPLRLSPGLTAAAEFHSLDMVRVGFFGHESADGRDFAARIRSFYRPRPRGGLWTVGENMAWQTRRLSARAAVVRWLHSPGHRENLLRARFREIGISAVRARAPGVFGHRRVVVLTVDFGAR